MCVMADLEPPSKKKRLSLSLTKRNQEAETSTSRFEATHEDEFESLSKRFVPKNTSISLKWSFRIYSGLSTVASGSENKERVLTSIQPTSPSPKKESVDASGKENQVGKMLKHINFQRMDGYTINFNFQS